MLHTHRQTHRQLKNGTLYAPRYEDAFLPIGKKRPHYEKHSASLWARSAKEIFVSISMWARSAKGISVPGMYFYYYRFRHVSQKVVFRNRKTDVSFLLFFTMRIPTYLTTSVMAITKSTGPKRRPHSTMTPGSHQVCIRRTRYQWCCWQLVHSSRRYKI